jgi:hypothetical protein
LKEILVFRRVAAADAVGLVMNVARRVVGVQDEAIDVRNVEMKDAGFAVVDPNNCVVVAGHAASFRE